MAIYWSRIHSYALSEEQIFIVEFSRLSLRNTTRGAWQPATILYDRDRDCFEESKWPKTFGRIAVDKNVREIFFCNKEGLTKVLKKMNVQSKWIIYKLMKKGK